jgi:inosine-uridine nucleoside N-ribohydrolase
MPTSEGVDFIIERAMQGTPENPLWLVLLGPATDAVAALTKEPRIADRLVVFWHGRTQWPVRCWNFNAYNDIKAARFIFDIPSRFILFDTGTYLTISMEETERRFLPLGPLGAFLHEFRKTNPYFQSPKKGFFDLGDTAGLVDPTCVRWEVAGAPAVDQDLRYDFTQNRGEIVRIYHVERDRAFDLLEEALRRIDGRRVSR